jgi:hypothetical protein
VASYWTRITADELDALTGDRASLVALVKRHYALATFEAEAQVDTWLAGIVRELATPAKEASAAEQRAENEGMNVVPVAPEPEER